MIIKELVKLALFQSKAKSKMKIKELVTDENFSELGYLLANPDVAEVILDNPFYSCWMHYIDHGKSERRMQFKPAMSDIQYHSHFLDGNVPVPVKLKDAHINQTNLMLEIGNKEGMKVLEIGSREVTGMSSARDGFTKAQYVGFDYYPGNNVDVVGDAHKLSTYFDADTKFDLIYSSAVFEHLAMPWVVAQEIAKLLKVGGTLFIETHFSFSSHERPWHFFQFSDMGLRSLFSAALGFECIEATMANPIVGKFSSLADHHLRDSKVGSMYCHSQYLGVKRHDVENFNWSDVRIEDITNHTNYPPLR